MHVTVVYTHVPRTCVLRRRKPRSRDIDNPPCGVDVHMELLESPNLDIEVEAVIIEMVTCRDIEVVRLQQKQEPPALLALADPLEHLQHVSRQQWSLSHHAPLRLLRVSEPKLLAWAVCPPPGPCPVLLFAGVRHVMSTICRQFGRATQNSVGRGLVRVDL